MALLFDGAKENTTTTGTGTITLGGSPTGYADFSDFAACVNGVLVGYVIEDGNDREVGIGTWNTGNTLSRTTIVNKLVAGVLSESPGTGLNLSGGAVVFSSATSNAFAEKTPLVGSVVQVVRKVITTKGSQSVASGSVDVLVGSGSDFKLTITPIYSNSWIKVEVRWFGEANSIHSMPFNIDRVTTRINSQATNNYSAISMATRTYGAGTDDTSTPEILGITTIDTTGTTADTSVEYSLTISNGTGSAETLWTNRCFTAPAAAFEQGTSEMILTEIAQ